MTESEPNNRKGKDSVEDGSSNKSLTYFPSMLLDMSGALTCLVPDLLSPLALSSAMYLLSQRPNMSRDTEKFRADFPTSFRQYCIRSVYNDGPYTDGPKDGRPGTEPLFSRHPKPSLRAIFDVIVWLDLAFSDTSFDR